MKPRSMLFVPAGSERRLAVLPKIRSTANITRLSRGLDALEASAGAASAAGCPSVRTRSKRSAKPTHRARPSARLPVASWGPSQRSPTPARSAWTA